jgi:TIR domain-containing protein/reverse transcriptase-like protein
MHDIFLSYSRSDWPTAQRLAEALERRGWSVFWDFVIGPGDDFERRIKKEAQAAGCVVALWSRQSVQSEWVLREAGIGRRRKRLLPVLIERIQPPAQFSKLSAVDLQGWTPDTFHAGFKELLAAVVGLIGGEPWKRAAFEAALRNIGRWGDTDVLPYPIEKNVFTENRSESLELLERTDAKFDTFVEDFRPYYETSLYPAGPSGFRWVTQIDPIWNAYLLGLVTAVGSRIEAVRSPAKQRIVFSYRFKPNAETGALFDGEIGWQQYQERSLVLAKKFAQVVVCDIADFYARISHEHVRQALQSAGADAEVADRILVLLGVLSGGDPYGLPIGGPAARLLSELVLQSVDNLLSVEGVTFCRFADDFHLFANDENDAYQKLMFLSETLFGRLGLTLQKSKTRVMSGSEFVITCPLTQAPEAPSEEAGGTGERWALLKLKIPFDPYAEEAIEKYEELRAEINKYDLLGMLARELAKSRPDPALTRNLINAVRYLSPENRNIAVQALLEAKTLKQLYPLLSNLLRTLKYLVKLGTGDESENNTFDLEASAQPNPDPGLDERTRSKIFDDLANLIQPRSYLMEIPAHLAYAVRVLVYDTRAETTSLLAATFKSARSDMVRRDIILAMARRRSTEWIRNLLRQEKNLTLWERRALLIASTILGGAGRIWRMGLAGRISPMDRLTLEWAQQRTSLGDPDEPL